MKNENLLHPFIDNLIAEVYQWSSHERTTIRILQYIGKKQGNLPHLPDFGCYYLQLAQIIDHFLQDVTGEPESSPDLSWFCKYWETFELKEKYVLDHVVITQKQQKVSFKKYMLERNPQQSDRFRRSALLCSKHMFQTLPDQIEVYDLTAGESTIEWSREKLPS